MDSVRSFLDAVEAFGDRLSQVHLQALAIALTFHCANLILRSRAWFNILRSAYPTEKFRWRGVLGAYAAGVGINALAPARGGDVVKILAVRQRVPDSSTPTLVSSLLAETVFDFLVASCLLTWAYSTGGIPTLPDLPSAPAWEWSFFARHERIFEIGAVIALFAAAVTVRWLAHRVRAFWERVEQGLAILRTPRVYLRSCVLFQALGWMCRLGTAYYLLEAFSVSATIENAALVLVVGSVSTLLPFTPGGAGAQQALLVIVLAGEASRSTILAYSVGAQVATTVLNAIIGFLALFLLFGGLRWRHLHDQHATRQPEPGGA